MKKIMALAIFLIAATTATLAQMSADKNIDKYNREIKSAERSIEKLNHELKGSETIDSIAYVTSAKEIQRNINKINSVPSETSYGKTQAEKLLKPEQKKLQVVNDKLTKCILLSYKKEERNVLIASIKKYEAEKISLLRVNTISTTAADQFESKRLTGLAYNQVNRGLDVERKIQDQKNDTRWEDASYKKLMASPVKGDSIKGYQGIVLNLSYNSRIQFEAYKVDATGNIRKGKPSGSWFVSAGDRKIGYLLPGEYLAVIYNQGVKIGSHTFHVTVQQHDFMGEQSHWYLTREGY